MSKKLWIVPTFRVVEAASADDAIEIVGNIQGRAASGEFFYQDERIDPKEVPDEEYHSILDYYDGALT